MRQPPLCGKKATKGGEEIKTSRKRGIAKSTTPKNQRWWLMMDIQLQKVKQN